MPNLKSQVALPEDDDSIQAAIAARNEIDPRPMERALEVSLVPPPDQYEGSAVHAASVCGFENGEQHVREDANARYSLRCAGENNRQEGHRDTLLKFKARTIGLQETVRKKLATTDRFLSVPADRVAWDLIDRTKLFLYVLLSCACVTIGLNQIRITAMASGYFDSELDAALFSFMPLGLAFLLESFQEWMPSDRSRNIYVRTVHGLGICAGAIWVWTFVQHFGGGLTDVSALDFGSLADFGAEDVGAESVGVNFLVASIAGEVLIAAALWSSIAALGAKHSPFRPTPNPAFVALDKLLGQLARDLTIAKDLCGRFQDRLEAVESGRVAYVNDALSQYHLACKGRENTALLSDHLRSRDRLNQDPNSDQASA